jgi:hypothetical protein
MEDKELIKEALKEWLDEKFAEFGKWTLRSLAAIVVGIILVYAVSHGLIKG